MFALNIQTTAKIIMETGPWLKISSDRLVKPVIDRDPRFTRQVVFSLHPSGSFIRGLLSS